MSVNYIKYFYHVFPLHLNTYCRLFSGVINPNLQKLTSSVSEFTCSTSDISEIKSFIDSLNGVSKYLNDFNPAEKLLELIKSFNGDKYAQEVGSNINKIIENSDINIKQIIRRLEIMNSNLCGLNCNILRSCAGYFPQTSNGDCISNGHRQPKYNLSKLKDYMKYLKVYITNIRKSFNDISAVIDKIKNGLSQIYRKSNELQSLEKFIESYIKWYESWPVLIIGNILKTLEDSVKYWKSIKDKINEIKDITKVFYKYSNLRSNADIESKLKYVESNIYNLECAIEGVARNLIRCSLLSLRRLIRVPELDKLVMTMNSVNF